MNASANVGDQTIPILPSRSIAQTLTFYRALGFAGDAHPHDAGYAILQRDDGRVVRGIGDANPGDALRARLHDGQLRLTVDGKESAP